MKFLLVTTTAVAVLANAAFAETEGRRLAGLAFDSSDLNGDGFITMEEFQSHYGDIFFSMDSDQNGSLGWDEFLNWGFGMQNVAVDTGRTQAYETARRIVFDTWDRSIDWKVSEAEQRRGVAADFVASDEDRDGRLSRDEYLHYSIQNVTLRSALAPDLE